jgi:hypothetical protein
MPHPRVKRFARRSLAIVVGLTLGWYAAGFSSAATSGDPHDAPAGDHDEAARAAAELAPTHEPTPWFRPVVGSAVGLFAAAIVLGIPALKLRGPLPPDPADVHDTHAAHDTHGHQDDSHGGHAHSHTPAETHPKH